MESRKLYELIRCLTNKEQKRFAFWLTAERSLNAEGLLIFYNALLSGCTNSGEIWKSVYPKLPYEDRKFRRIAHTLTEILEEYLAIEEFRSNTSLKSIALLKALNRKKCGNIFMATYNKIQKRMKKQFQNTSYFRTMYELEKEYQQYLIHHSGKHYPKREREINETFDLWMLHEKLFLSLVLLNYQLNHEENIPILFKDVFLNEVRKKEKYYNIGSLSIYLMLFDLLQNHTGTSVATLKKISSHFSHLQKDEAQNLFFLILNHFIRLTNIYGDKIHLDYLYRWYVSGIEQKWLLIEGVLPVDHYKNLITAALKLSQLEAKKREERLAQAYSFVDELKKFLPTEHQEEAYRFSKGIYYLVSGDTSKGLKSLSEKFSNKYYEIQAKYYCLKARYEQGEREELRNAIRALKKYILQQQGYSVSLKESYLKNLSFLMKLLRYKTPNSLNGLLLSVGEAVSLHDKEWFLQKIQNKLSQSQKES